MTFVYIGIIGIFLSILSIIVVFIMSAINMKRMIDGKDFNKGFRNHISSMIGVAGGYIGIIISLFIIIVGLITRVS